MPSAFGPRGTWQAIWQARSSTGKSTMRTPPLLPASRFAQLTSTPQPSGETMPRPVTTTRLMACSGAIPPQGGSPGFNA